MSIRKLNIFFLFLLFIPFSYSYIEGRICEFNGDCELNTLIVQNLTVAGDFFNVSVVNYNVTGVITITGNVTASGMIKADSFLGDFFGGTVNATSIQTDFINFTQAEDRSLVGWWQFNGNAND